IVLDGSADYSTYNLTGGEFNSNKISIVFEFWPEFAADDNVSSFLIDTTGGRTIVRKNSVNQLQVYLGGTTNVGTVALASYQALWLQNKRNVIQVSSTSGGGYTYIHFNGVLVKTSTVSWTITNTSVLFVGAAAAAANHFKGTIGEVKIIKGLLDEQDAVGYYNQDLYDYRDRALVDLPMGAAEHDPSNLSGVELIVDGDMGAAGVSSWAPVNGATISKEVGTPHSGTQCLRITAPGSSAYYAKQTILTVGKSYFVTGWTRSDGSKIPQVACPGHAVLWSGTTSTSWQEF
ncbi:MAG: LamG domain-containing protein, partial [Planctomycetes bacterium]|nr:LamG domain-containing protein [Planctomycetota bacterium]